MLLLGCLKNHCCPAMMLSWLQTKNPSWPLVEANARANPSYLQWPVGMAMACGDGNGLWGWQNEMSETPVPRCTLTVNVLNQSKVDNDLGLRMVGKSSNYFPRFWYICMHMILTHQVKHHLKQIQVIGAAKATPNMQNRSFFASFCFMNVAFPWHAPVSTITTDPCPGFRTTTAKRVEGWETRSKIW